MRSLLKTKERRQLEIVEFLLDTKGWTTNAELAEFFESSPRIIKADLAELRQKLPQLQFEAGYLGVRLTKDSTIGIQSIYRIILQETLIYQLLEEIFFDETLSIEDLADKFFVSHSTIYRSITQINDYFNEYQCYIEANPCRFVGNEQNIRFFYRTFFTEKYSVLGWPFRDIDEEKVNQTFDKMLSLVASDMPVDFAYYESIKIVVLVNKIRYNHHHLVDTTEDESELLNIFINIYKYVIQPLGSSQSMQINKESFYQVFGPYIRKDVAKNKKQLRKFMSKPNRKGIALRFLDRALLDFSDKWQLSINLEDILLAVHNTAINAIDLLNSDFILFDRNKYFVLKFKSYMPEFYDAFRDMIKGFCERLNLSTNDYKINYLLFTLITHWDGLLSEYNQHHLQVSLVILSDQHFSHSKMIQNFLEFELHREVTLEVHSGQNMSESVLQKLNCDIIISNFTLPEIDGKEVVVIHDFPTSSDLIYIKNKINTVRTNRSVSHRISEAI